jgi:molecular chaperone GrpE (heat shock protein)
VEEDPLAEGTCHVEGDTRGGVAADGAAASPRGDGHTDRLSAGGADVEEADETTPPDSAEGAAGRGPSQVVGTVSDRDISDHDEGEAGTGPPAGADPPSVAAGALAVAVPDITVADDTDARAAADVVADLATASAAATARLDDLTQRVEELIRLRCHDSDLVDRLHAENTRLRAGELTEAMAPLLRGLMRLHDQMTSLGADDGQSIAGILRKQLLQIMDVAADIRPYTAVVGLPFDPVRHVGMRRVGTDDSSRDRTIARTLKPGFVRGESTVVRPAEVEVFRAH